jgi:Flp pilus assembly protein TadD
MSDRRELLERYEAFGEEADYLAAKPLNESAAAETTDPQLLRDYVYLLFSHARYEMRRAVEQYKRAIELDPDDEKVHYQLIFAMATLGDADDMLAIYRERHVAAPTELRENRLLASAYLAAREFESAHAVAAGGLELAPDDPALLALRGDAKAGTGDPEGAMADWRRALELDGEDIGPLYSSAFLLEREGQLAEAADAWERSSRGTMSAATTHRSSGQSRSSTSSCGDSRIADARDPPTLGQEQLDRIRASS